MTYGNNGLRGKLTDTDKIEAGCRYGLSCREIGVITGRSAGSIERFLKKPCNSDLAAMRKQAKAQQVEEDYKARLAAKEHKEKMLSWEHKCTVHNARTSPEDIRRIQKSRVSRARWSRSNQGVDFEVKWEDLEWPTHCPILGIELDYVSRGKGHRPNFASFDRLDSNKGYVKGNVHVVSFRANTIKNAGTAEEHLKIYEWMKSKGAPI